MKTGISLVVSFSLMFAAYPLGAWGYRRFDPIYGEGPEGLVVPFVVLPVVAGTLAWYAMRAVGKWMSLALGAFVAALVITFAVLGWRSEF